VQRRIEKELDEFYPDNRHGEKPWGYLWAQVIPCDGCEREFPLYGSNVLLYELKGRPGTSRSFELRVSDADWTVEVVEGMTTQLPTMRARDGKRGKLAWCPFPDCGHAHELREHKRLVRENYHRVEMLVAIDRDGADTTFRRPTDDDLGAPARAGQHLSAMSVNGLAARPDELPLKGTDRIGAVLYGAEDFGDLAIDRQNLLHAVIARSVTDIARELAAGGVSTEYVSCLSGFSGASLVKKLRRSTRGVRLQTYRDGRMTGSGDLFVNESSLGFNYDFVEVGIGDGAGTWKSASGVPTFFSGHVQTDGRPANVQRGSALSIPHRSGGLDAVVTDPPYEMMITYSDASDLFYVWLKRALGAVNPDFAMTANPKGTQEKAEEIIVHKHHSGVPNEHRTPEFYKSNIAKAFAECRRVVHDDGVVTIVFGHGDPDAWRALLDAISDAGLVLTGAWPANTEKGGAAGSANITTTMTLACRPAPAGRSDGRVAEVDAEMRRVVAERVRTVWNPSGLSYVDQKMAAAGPALEVVGRYGRILDKRGQPVDLTRYLPLARQAVTDAHNLTFDQLPLDTFDQKTRFALEWVRSFGRKVQAASEARWQRLAADLEESDTEGVLTSVDKGVRLAFSKEAKVKPIEGLSLFEVALAAAVAWREGTLADAAAVIRTCKVEPDDPHFWACVNALSKNLPETDKDGAVWTSMVRNREALAAGIANAEAAAAVAVDRAKQAERAAELNPALFNDPNSLFGQEGN
jgi:putative DNA methylase